MIICEINAKKEILLFFVYSLIMQIKINNNLHLVQAATSRNHSGTGVKLIDILIDFDEIARKIEKPKWFFKNVVRVEDVTKYLPKMDRLRYQGLIYFERLQGTRQNLLIKIYRILNLKLSYLQFYQWTWIVWIYYFPFKIKKK